MSKEKNGGQAFPVAGSEHNYPIEGMSLRDYFAARAMSTLCASCSHEEAVAIKAYRYADEMLKAREI